MDFRKFDNQWFALHVKTRFEQTCARILCGKGYEDFLPLCKTGAIERHTKTVSQVQPLFPGYLFCRLNSDAKGPVLTTPGVLRIVGYGAVPSPISDEEITALKSIVESTRNVCGWPFLHVGKRIRLMVGPLRGLEGILLRFKNIHRVVVSISLLQRSAAVEVEADWVASAEPIAAHLHLDNCIGDSRSRVHQGPPQQRSIGA